MTSKRILCRREKRFLLFTPEYIMGGAETQFRYLIDYAEKNKWRLDVIIEHRIKKEIAVLPMSVREMKNVRVYELDWRMADKKKILLSTVNFIIRMMPHIKYKGCIIHFTPDLVLAPILKILGIPVIYSERVDAATICKDLLFQKCLWYCDGILANSVYAKKELEIITGREVGLIRNGKPVVEQFPLKKELRIDNIFVPANISPHKNQMIILQYLKEHPEFLGKITFAGYILDKQYHNKLVKFAESNHLQEKIEFLGYVEDMEEEYRKADLVILPSLSEGTPNVVLEAYAYGRPVIVSDIGVERAIVRNPKLRFGIRSVTELDECIKYVQGMSNETYKRLLERNRKFVLENYSIERMAEAFYKELSKGRRYSLFQLGIIRFLHFYKCNTIKGESI